MTPKAQKFYDANKLSGVIAGRVINIHGALAENFNEIYGAIYTLENGSSFELTVQDSRSLPGKPRWIFD
jgi:hypothetical protein